MPLTDLPAFDPGIIERHVENTYRKANAVFMGSVVAGVMMGAAFGATPLTSLGASWPIPRMFGFATMFVGAIIGGVIGYLIGDTRAFLARLQGQTALAQIEAAKDARRALEAVQQIQALATKRAAAAAPPPPAEQPPPAVLAAPPPVTPALRPPEPVPAAPLEAVPPTTPALEAVPAPVVPVAPVAPVAPAPPLEAVPPAPPVEAPPAPVAAPAPPTLVVAGGTAEPAPPLTPPVSS